MRGRNTITAHVGAGNSPRRGTWPLFNQRFKHLARWSEGDSNRLPSNCSGIYDVEWNVDAPSRMRESALFRETDLAGDRVVHPPRGIRPFAESAKPGTHRVGDDRGSSDLPRASQGLLDQPSPVRESGWEGNIVPMRTFSQLRGLLACTIVTLSMPAADLRADAAAPTESERRAADVVSRLMEKFQISRHEVDDEISTRMFKAYLNVFDPLKIYFRMPDIEQLRPQATKLDDDLKNGARLNFAFDVYKLYLARLDECAAWADEFAEAPHDFTKEETINVDPDTAKYAATVEEARERWRVRVKFELESLVVDGKTLEEAKERVHKRYKNLKTRWHELSSTEVVEMYLSTLTNSFDPHSTYMSPDTLEDFEIHMRLSLEGIGAMLQSEDGTTVVKELVPGGAADKDGRIKRGDQIVGVGEGENGEIEDIVEMKLRDVVKKIRGKAGTVVRLEVIPDGQSERKTYNLIRQRVELADSAAKGEVIEYNDPTTGGVRKIGVVTLPSFYADQGDGELFGNAQAANLRTATNDVRKILDDFKAKGVEGVVVDLRINGGGYSPKPLASPVSSYPMDPSFRSETPTTKSSPMPTPTNRSPTTAPWSSLSAGSAPAPPKSSPAPSRITAEASSSATEPRTAREPCRRSSTSADKSPTAPGNTVLSSSPCSSSTVSTDRAPRIGVSRPMSFSPAKATTRTSAKPVSTTLSILTRSQPPSSLRSNRSMKRWSPKSVAYPPIESLRIQSWSSSPRRKPALTSARDARISPSMRNRSARNANRSRVKRRKGKTKPTTSSRF